jgi:hypothetical protein
VLETTYDSNGDVVVSVFELVALVQEGPPRNFGVFELEKVFLGKLRCYLVGALVAWLKQLK